MEDKTKTEEAAVAFNSDLFTLQDRNDKACQDLRLVRSWIDERFPATAHRTQLISMLKAIEENLGGDR